MQKFSDIYQRAVMRGALSLDSGQDVLLPLFDRLAAKLCAPKKYRFFPWQWGRPRRGGLYLWGEPGRGKSQLVDMFFQYAPVAGKKRIHFHMFMQDFHRQIHAERKRGSADPLAPVAARICKDLDLLCLDEMQISDITDAMIVGRLFSHIVSAGVMIVTSANRPPQDLYKDGLNRALFLPFIKMLETELEVVQLAGTHDYRRGKLYDSARYIYPLTPANVQIIDRIWDRVSEGRAKPIKFRLAGRDLVVEKFYNGAARIDFASLCEKPLGAEDYILLTTHLRLLIVENIPILTEKSPDILRRFIIFIDTAYEARMTIIFSAEAPANKLYCKEHKIFEFARTLSRIHEICGADWSEQAC